MRIETWVDALQSALENHMGQPFQWGVSDCGILFADAVLAMTGKDPLYDIRGRYKTARGALLALKRSGYSGVMDLVAARFDEIAPINAGRGDLVFPEKTDRLSSPAVLLGMTGLSKNETGSIIIPRELFIRAYRVH